MGDTDFPRRECSDVFAPLVLSRSINTPRQANCRWTNRRASVRPRARARSLAPARSPLYRYFCSGLSFLSGAPLLHHGLFKVSRRRRRARACACAMLDVGQQAGYGLYTDRVAKPLTYMFTYACARVVHVHTASQQARSMRARVLTYVHTDT